MVANSTSTILIIQIRRGLAYLVPSVVVPHKRQVVCNGEGSIFIENSQITAASWPSRQPHNYRICLKLPGFEEIVEHPASYINQGSLVLYNFCKKQKMYLGIFNVNVKSLVTIITKMNPYFNFTQYCFNNHNAFN